MIFCQNSHHCLQSIHNTFNNYKFKSFFMKQILLKSLCIFFAMMMLTMQSFAYTLKASNSISSTEIEAVTQFDDSEIYASFADVSALDQYLSVNEGKSYSDVFTENSSILTGVSSTSSLPLSPADNGDRALGIPSFLWGCALGWVGMLIVYLVTENKEETKKALWGCIISTVVSVVFYVVVIAAEASTVTY
jgi:hypothetical protein